MNKKKAGIAIGIAIAIVIVVGTICLLLPKKEKEITYKINFNNDGVVETINVKENSLIEPPTNPTKEGYTFDGWYYNGTKFDFSIKAVNDMTLEARWIPNSAKTWKVTFDVAGGEKIDSLDVVDGEKIDKIPTPTKEGYTFDGWYYNGTKFDFEQKITKNITLIAHWDKLVPENIAKYTVTFNTDGGTKISSQTVQENKTVSRPNDPTKEGYIFLDWYNGNDKFDFKTRITKNITLLAKWKKIENTEEPKPTAKYTVTFNTDGGNQINSQTIEENKTVSKPNDPTKDGYTFIGWYSNDVLYNFNTLVTSNITLTAKWEKISVITYKIEAIPDSYVGQVKVFILKDGVKVDATANLTTQKGKVKTVEISKDGLVDGNYIVGDIIKTIDNIKVK